MLSDLVFFYYHNAGTLHRDLADSCFEIINSSKVNYTMRDGAIQEHTILIAKKAREWTEKGNQ